MAFSERTKMRRRMVFVWRFLHRHEVSVAEEAQGRVSSVRDSSGADLFQAQHRASAALSSWEG